MPKSKKPPKPTITLEINAWAVASLLAQLGPQRLLDELNKDDPPERTAWRRQREQEARKGNVTALADLIKVSRYYLAWPWTVGTIEALRSQAFCAHTPALQQAAITGLKMLGKALLPNLRGQKCSPSSFDVVHVYEKMLKAYKTAKRGEEPPKVELPLGYWPDTGPCPPHVTPAGPYTPRPGKLTLPLVPHFTIPAEDITLLKSKRSGCTPSALALARTGEIFGLSEARIQKYITVGRKEERERKEER